MNFSFLPNFLTLFVLCPEKNYRNKTHEVNRVVKKRQMNEPICRETSFLKKNL